MMRMFGPMRPFLPLVLALVLLLGWGGGFLGFIDNVQSYRQPSIDERLASAQGIVALTGGSERLAAGIDLLKAGKGKKLLISGVHASVKAEGMARMKGLPEQLMDCCIVLGHEASNTRGNAREAKAFMKDNGYVSMLLVTAHYHMPRSLLLFEKTLPDVAIVPFPVQPDSVDVSFWWRRLGTSSLLFMEYNKYLFARLCLWIGVYS